MVLLNALSIELWRREEAISQAPIAPEELTRRLADNSLYAVQKAGFDFCIPSWQFHESVQEAHLKELVDKLHEAKLQVHAFFVTQEDELNELSPAEVLAGTRFAPRRDLHKSQMRLLTLSVDERLAKLRSLLQRTALDI